jgi:arylsulfatase
VFLWNMVDLERIKWEGADALSPAAHGRVRLQVRGNRSGTLHYNNFSGLGQPGTGTLKVDGKEVATKAMPKTLPMILQWDESFRHRLRHADRRQRRRLQAAVPLTAKLNKLTIKVDRPQLSPRTSRDFRQRCRRRQRATDPALCPSVPISRG